MDLRLSWRSGVAAGPRALQQVHVRCSRVLILSLGLSEAGVL